MMGDFRFNALITVTGIDGETAKIDWWLNWDEKIPKRLHDELVRKAAEVGLPVNYFPDFQAELDK